MYLQFGHDNIISSFKFMFHSFFTHTNQPTTTRIYIFLTFKVMLKKFLHHFLYHTKKQTSSTNSQTKLLTCVHLCHHHITKYFTTSQSINTHFISYFDTVFQKTLSNFKRKKIFCTKFGIKSVWLVTSTHTYISTFNCFHFRDCN